MMRGRAGVLAAALFSLAGMLNPLPQASGSESAATGGKPIEGGAGDSGQGESNATPKEGGAHGTEAPAIHGPATSAPREILDMLEQRRRVLDKREAALRGAETHLLELKAELEQIVTRYEKTAEGQKRRSEAAAKVEADRKAKEEKVAADTRNVSQAQLAKIYEAMPPEEAASRIERMPERKAIELLRLLKGKSAGAILAAVRPERAAHLTEQLLNAP
ncbi:MAG: hypothetical protein KF814_13880 [Nitrospiraceae bacterium]|nr:hypothetical protein [Nitrospiraceae bacterium]